MSMEEMGAPESAEAQGKDGSQKRAGAPWYMYL